MIELHFVNTTAFQEVFYTTIIILGYIVFALFLLIVIDNLLYRIKRLFKRLLKRGRRER